MGKTENGCQPKPKRLLDDSIIAGLDFLLQAWGCKKCKQIAKGFVSEEKSNFKLAMKIACVLQIEEKKGPSQMG